MSSTDTRYEHIMLDSAGVPFIRATKTKVVELVQEQLAYGWSAEELHFQHPHLSLGQIHSALAYYWDHKDKLDRDLEHRLRRVDDLRRMIPASPFEGRGGADG